MKILFYVPTNQFVIYISSLMIAFQQQGHQVFLLTQSPKGELHFDVEPYGVLTSAYYPNKK
jgi:hypothetical protein